MLPVANRQYFISPVRYSITDMHEIVFGEGLYVYIGEGLDYIQSRDRNGKDYLILGDVYCSETNLSVEDAVSDYDGSGINDLVYKWTGRWIVIGEDEVQIDACGLMQAFYGEHNNNWFVSSSLALINAVTELQIGGEVDNDGINWQLLPLTLIDGVKSLICTQKIRYTLSDLVVLPNLWVKDLSALTTDAKVEILTGNLKATLCNVQKFSGRDIWIALTAGKDSRLVLAAAISAGIKFQTYTAEHSNISHSDVKLPGKIAKHYGFTHRFIRAKKKSDLKAREYLDFNGGNSKGADLEFYANGQFDCIPSDAIVIRGGIFEAGQRFGRTILTDEINHLKEDYTKYYNKSFECARQTDALDLWIQNAIEYPISFMDIRDRLYLEQRVGGWVASIEQALGINKWTSLQLANNRENLSVLLSASEEERGHTLLAYSSIEKLEKGLLDYGVNERNMYDVIKYYTKILLNPQKIVRYLKMRF